MLTSTGVLAAYDSRTPCGSSCGSLGYLLQATTYIAGISGGSWLVISNYVNDLRPVHELLHDDRTWSLHQKLLEGVPDFDPTSMREKISSPVDKESMEVRGTNWGVADNILRFFGIGKTSSLLEETRISKNNDFLKDMVRTFFLKTNSAQKSKGSSREAFKFFKDLQIEVRTKKQAGFPISFTDYWGRALARKLFQFLYRAPGITLTSCTKLPSFATFQQPYPLIVAAEKSPNSPEDTNRIFEFSPYEFGSWGLGAFVKLKYLGTSLYKGFPSIRTENVNISICTSGYDNVGFVIGTSSSLFNQVFLYLYKMLMRINQDASRGILTVLAAFGLGNSLTHVDYALISPNPFYGLFAAKDEVLSTSHNLYLADGGDTGENIPFDSLMVKPRGVDIIFAFDMTSDMNNYPNGTSLAASSLRYHTNRSSLYFTAPYKNSTKSREVFPFVPTPEELLKWGLDKPMFLGCYPDDYPPVPNTKDYTSGTSPHISMDLPPLIVYTPNYEYSFPSNTSTFQLSYTLAEVLAITTNGYNAATANNATAWAHCVGCAILKRQFDRRPAFRPPRTCAKCFLSYCYKTRK